MNFVESYDTEDVTEDNEPKDLSYSSASDTANDFPTLKLSPDAIPAGNANPSCVHFAWWGKEDKHGPESSEGLDEGSFKPFGNQNECSAHKSNANTWLKGDPTTGADF